MTDLSGLVAVVTGGNDGIGYGIAEALAQAGADIAVWGRRAERNESRGGVARRARRVDHRRDLRRVGPGPGRRGHGPHRRRAGQGRHPRRQRRPRRPGARRFSTSLWRSGGR